MRASNFQLISLLFFIDSNHFVNESAYDIYTNPNRSTAFQQSINNNSDDRPITPMRGTYRQIAEKFGDEDGLPIDPNLTNQYYEAYNDFENEEDYSPTREQKEREFYDRVCRSFNGQETTTQDKRRRKSPTLTSTINSMSRTINPRNPMRQSKYIAPLKTMTDVSKQKSLSNKKFDNNSVTLKDNPSHDAYGPLAKNKKISSLRR